MVAPYRKSRAATVLIGLLALTTAHAGGAILTHPTTQGTAPLQTWKERRDAHLVKQDLDYSCGAASLATILTSFYGQAVTEQAILETMEADGAASFADLAAAAQSHGFRAVGVALDIAQLQKLKIPALVYLRYRGDDHFSVLRGISADQAWLGDPAWGNRHITLARFRAMWHTRDERPRPGKALLILPAEDAHVAPAREFFRAPESSPIARRHLVLRPY